MVWMMVTACSWLQVLTEFSVEMEDIRTDGGTEEIWLLVRPALLLPRVAKVCAVKV